MLTKTALLTSLTALSLTPSTTQQTALDGWVIQYLPRLSDDAKALLQGNFSVSELYKFAELAVQAAQELKGVLSGQERAKVAQAVLHIAVKQYAPLIFQSWALPLVDGAGCTALIESAFQRLFGSDQHSVTV